MSVFGRALQFLDSHASAPGAEEDRNNTIVWSRTLPWIGMHLVCGFVLLTGWSWFAVGLMVASYIFRIFGITVGYHRYFSHRAFRAGRLTQFFLAYAGAAATQRGPLWWASHHRHHHKFSDQDADPHSPVAHSFLHSHLGWIFTVGNYRTRLELIKDYAKFPEILFINRFDLLVPISYGVLMFFIGYFANLLWPALGTSGWQTLIWGYFISTVICYHFTFSINSLTHQSWLGRRRYETTDSSRNVALLSLFTFGEAWHNNHHYFAASSRMGFFWWEVDLGWYSLKIMEKLGLVWGFENGTRALSQALTEMRSRLPPIADKFA